jgi:cell division protein FtsL
MAYMHGNLALQPKKREEQKTAVRENKRTVVKKRTVPVQEKLLYLFTIIVCVVVASVIIFRYAQIYQMNYEIKTLTTNYDKINVEMKELQKKVETLSDPSRIEKAAIANGMAYNDQSSDSVITVPIGDSQTQTAMKE